VIKNLKERDLKLSHAEFDSNRALSYATSNSPFEACYQVSHFTPIDLIPLPIENRVSFEAQ